MGKLDDGGPKIDDARGQTLDLAALFRRTWELELLISGAVLFALFQLPSRLFTGIERLRVSFEEGSFLILFMGHIYLLFIVYVLIATLIVHLAGRAYWIGLIGLRSVFPQGVRWRHLTTFGPRSKRFYRAAQPTLQTLIRTTDAFCSSLFSIAFFLSFMFAVSIVIVAPMAGLALLLDRAFFAGERFILVFYVLLAVTLAPSMLLPILDKKIARKGRGDRLERLLRIALRPYYWLFGAPLVGPIQMTFLSNSRKLVFWVVYGLIFVALFGTLFGSLLALDDALSFDDLRYFPARGSEHVLSSCCYEDQRSPGEIHTTPSIPSDVVTGPYLRLFLPYVPRFHNEQLEKHCPDLEPLQSGALRFRGGSRYRPPSEAERAASAAALTCLAGLYRVELDGAPPAEVDRSFYRHPGSGVRGLLLHLPTGGLAPGKHVLRIETRRGLADDDSDGDDGRREYVIPFWH